MNRLPDDAYAVYAAMGPNRSYQAVADRYGVSKGAVGKRAKKENWPAKVAELEKQAAQESEAKAVEEMKAVKARQLQAARYLQARAVEVLKSQPAERGLRAANALQIGWKHELLLLGEPTERQANIEEITKRELARWLCVEETADGSAESGQPPDAEERDDGGDPNP